MYDSSQSIRPPLLILVAGLTFSLICVRLASAQVASMPISMELALDSATIRVGENPVLTVRVANPNAFSVELPAFELGYVEPALEVLERDGVWRPLTGANPDFFGTYRGEPVRIDAGQAIAKRRFLYDEFHPSRWPRVSGSYSMRAVPRRLRTARDEQGMSRPVEWASNVVELLVLPLTSKDAAALQFMREKWPRLTEAAPARGSDAHFERLTATFSEFLDLFSDTAYAAEVCFHVTASIAHLAEAETVGPELRRLDGLANRFEACACSCLDNGAPFDDNLLRWNPGTGLSPGMTVSVALDRASLLERIVAALDSRMPNDAEGSLYRKYVLATARGAAVAERQEIAAQLEREFSTGRLARFARDDCRYLKSASSAEPTQRVPE